VGKSTLFNSLIRRRRAITDSMPGVTRDAVEEECELTGSRALLIDTGGYTYDGDALTDAVGALSLKTARGADLVLLVLDAADVRAEDLGFMERLRPLSGKIILVVNKVDTPDRDTLVWNFHSYGFADVIGVSAAHGRNVQGLRDLIASRLNALAPAAGTATGQRPARRRRAEGAPIRVAILGKPNTGKSSLLNRLVGEEKALVSDIPGTTRDVVAGRFLHKGAPFEVLDTAGIRRKGKVTDDVEYYSVHRALSSIKECHVVFLMIDAVEGLAEQDKKIAAQIVEEGRGIVLVLNKWDLMERTPAEFRRVRDRVRFLFPVLSFAPLLPVSARTGYGVKDLLDTAVEVHAQLNLRVSTGHLNAAVQEWVARYPLPVRGKNYKIRYATQLGVDPVRFTFIVNKLHGFPLSYGQYLENRIREELGFPLIPLDVRFRESRSRSQ